MRRFIFWVSILAAAVVIAQAEPISPQRAKQIAQKQMQKAPQGLRSADELSLTKTVPVSADMLRSTTNEVVAYYIFNRGNDGGFVIVAGDDQAPEILGYSYSGHFDLDNAPSNLKGWMQGYQQTMAALADGVATIETSDVSHLRAAKSPLLDSKDIKWDQDNPWNYYVPKISGQTPPIGCVATAMGQIMAYHEWPKEAEGKFTRYSVYKNGDVKDGESYDFNGHKYDWAQILKNAKANNYDPVGRAAVGGFMIDVANAVNMNFGIDGSGAFDNDALNAFRNHFRYKRNAAMAIRALYSAGRWEAMLRNELDNDRPVFYTGGDNDGGHAFVCDGYDANGRYHFNWGWNGHGNGFYALTSLKPTETGTGAGMGNYTRNQQMIIDLIPARNLNDRGVEPPARLVLGYNNDYRAQLQANQSKANVRFRYYLNPMMDYKVSFASRLFCYDENDKVVDALCTPEKNTENLLFLLYVNDESNIPVEKFELNKTYTYRCMYKLKGTDNWIEPVVYANGNKQVTVKRTSENSVEIKHQIQQGAPLAVAPIETQGAESADMIKVYPTVATDAISVDLGQEQNGMLTIVDMQGATVSRIQASGREVRVDISGLVSGTYFVRFGNATARLIVR